MLAAIAAGLGPVTPAFIPKRPWQPKIASKRLPPKSQIAFTPRYPDLRTLKKRPKRLFTPACRVLAATGVLFKSP
jgi:hypothetical protein